MEFRTKIPNYTLNTTLVVKSKEIFVPYAFTVCIKYKMCNNE